jgi:hypothetical protein
MIMGNLSTVKRLTEEAQAEEMTEALLLEYQRGYKPGDITLDFCIWLQKRAEALFK